jgi:signal transduction histidine kinase
MTDISGLAVPRSDEVDTVEIQNDVEQIAFALSHDLQAPLNSLASHAAMLKQAVQTESEDVRTAIDEVDGLTSRMQQMLDSILEFSVLDAPDEHREIVSLDVMLEEAIANWHSQIDESGATIEHQTLPPLAIARPQMTQVFQNLINNAIKFRGTRIPRIRISAVETGEYLRIRFEDNGIGIESADKERIFDMFHRLHGDTVYPGVGAGLAICRRIVRAHGGEVGVESTPGRGSCFILKFRGASVRMLNASGGTNEAVG